FELAQKFTVIAHLRFIRGKMAVPKQSHLLLKGPGAGYHPVGPPVADAIGFKSARAKPVEKLVHDGLKTAIPAGFDFDAERFAVLLRHAGKGRPAGRKGFKSGVVDSRMFERRQLAGVVSFETDQS